MTQPEERLGSWPWWTLVVLAVVLASEVIWYPELATLVSRDILKQGDAGSVIFYYRDIYVLPGAVALGVIIAAATVIVRRNSRLLIRVLWGAWAADLVLLCFSLWRYFAHLSAAER